MREYELTVVYDLAVAEAGGQDASVAHLTNMVESRGGKVLKVDHWGRRRLAYPIGRAMDADYVVSRIDIDPAGVSPLEAALKIDERVYRHLVVRADELPVPPPPREPRQQPAAAAQAPVAEPVAAEPVAAEPAADETAAAEPVAIAPEATKPSVAEAPAEEAPAAEAEAPAAPAEVVESAPATAAEPAGEPEAREDAAAGAETSA